MTDEMQTTINQFAATVANKLNVTATCSDSILVDKLMAVTADLDIDLAVFTAILDALKGIRNAKLAIANERGNW